jgi:hypothetical protein
MGLSTWGQPGPLASRLVYNRWVAANRRAPAFVYFFKAGTPPGQVSVPSALRHPEPAHTGTGVHRNA